MNWEGRFSAGRSRVLTPPAKRKDSPKLQAIDGLINLVAVQTRLDHPVLDHPADRRTP